MRNTPASDTGARKSIKEHLEEARRRQQAEEHQGRPPRDSGAPPAAAAGVLRPRSGSPSAVSGSRPTIDTGAEPTVDEGRRPNRTTPTTGGFAVPGVRRNRAGDDPTEARLEARALRQTGPRDAVTTDSHVAVATQRSESLQTDTRTSSHSGFGSVFEMPDDLNATPPDGLPTASNGPAALSSSPKLPRWSPLDPKGPGKKDE